MNCYGLSEMKITPHVQIFETVQGRSLGIGLSNLFYFLDFVALHLKCPRDTYVTQTRRSDMSPVQECFFDRFQQVELS